MGGRIKSRMPDLGRTSGLYQACTNHASFFLGQIRALDIAVGTTLEAPARRSSFIVLRYASRGHKE